MQRKKSTRRLLRATAVATALAVSMLTAPADAEIRADDQPVVETHSGAVRGTTTPTTDVFQGIPYAAPPVGELRWRSPRPPDDWSGVRDATEPGSRCLQQAQGKTRGSEDCLYLNVEAPRGHDGDVPVLVFLHGGGFADGAATDYETTRLVENGAVVVTVNYRLGALGWLAHPRVGDPAVGNFGLADQRMALRWVRRNIAAFGGDPRNVTLWGQSAGALSTCVQIASPGARRLFDKAIVQSGPCGTPALPRAQAYDRSRHVAAQVGCEPQDIDCLRGVSDDALLDASPPGPELRTKSTDRTWMPVAGTPLLPVQPIAAFRLGAANGLPLLQGGTQDEMRGFVFGHYDGRNEPLTKAEYRDVVRDLYGRDARAVLARYRPTDHPTPSVALASALSDEGALQGTCHQLTANDAVRTPTVYAYEFAEPAGRVGDFPLGAYHTSDLRFLLDSSDSATYPAPPLTPEERPLGERMVDAWTTFAESGHPPAGWPRYRHGLARSLSTDGAPTVDLASTHRCGFWRHIDR